MKKSTLLSRFQFSRYATLLAIIIFVSSMSFPKIAFAAEFTCNPVDVATFPGKRIHVRCSPGSGAIQWFALGVSNEGEANRMLSILSTAFALQKKLTIWYSPNDTSGANIGCNPNDCRLIEGARMF